MKRIFATGLAILLLLGCLTGCQSTPDTPSDETQNSTSDTLPGESQNSTSETLSGESQNSTSDILPGESLNSKADLSDYESRYGSPEQDALVSTALAYLARGSRIQYDDTRLFTRGSFWMYRWQVGEKSPEEYTSQFTGYLNCAAFTYEVYREALNYDITTYTTASLVKKNTDERIYTYYPTGAETDEEKAAVEADFRANLEVGDIIVIRYRDINNGHAMLYVGEEVLSAYEGTYDIIHSTGSNYNYEEQTEVFEEEGTIQMMSTDKLFDPEYRRYVFTELTSLCIVRPLNTYKGGIPEKTMNRMQNLEDILAEKLSSHTYGTTVNPGDTMTFTFSLTNYGNRETTVEIKDTVPSNTSYVSGAQEVNGNELSWTLTVPAGGTARAVYTVKVNENAAYGDTVYSDAGIVGGVPVCCPKVYIAKTLTPQEQAAIQSAATDLSSNRGIALADEIYTKALDRTTDLSANFEELMDALYTPRGMLNAEGGLLDRIVPGMFGGRSVIYRFYGDDEHRLEDIRTRLPYTRDLIPGDIIVAEGSGETANQELYLVLGDTLLDLMTGETLATQPLLDRLLGYKQFAILRPSCA